MSPLQPILDKIGLKSSLVSWDQDLSTLVRYLTVFFNSLKYQILANPILSKLYVQV